MYGWGIDVGIGSLGFSVVEFDRKEKPEAIVDGISHIFPSAIGGVERRTFKSTRTQHWRRRRRIAKLEEKVREILNTPTAQDEGVAGLRFRPMDGLCCYSNEAESLQTTARVHLRAFGLSQKLSGDDLFKAILHIARNRGVRLSRGLSDRADDKNKDREKDNQEQDDKAQDTQFKLADLAMRLGRNGDEDPATPGELLFERMKKGETTRLRKDRDDSPVFTRKMMTRELERLLNAQAAFHPTLVPEEVRGKLMGMVFWEEKPKDPVVGKCMYAIKDADNEIELRQSVGTDLFQTKRIYEEINNLRLRDRRTARESPLSLDQRDSLARHVLGGENITPTKLRKLLNLGTGATAPLTNLEESSAGKGRKEAGKIPAHPVAEALRKADPALLKTWEGWNTKQRECLFTLLREKDDREEVVAALQDRFSCSEEVAKKIAEAKISARRSAAGPTATGKLLDGLRAAVISNQEAAEQAGLQESDLESGERLDRLPYYGELFSSACVGGTRHAHDTDEIRYGRIPNPVVHTALNRIRKLANEYVKRWGPPARINIELARDLNKSEEERKKIENLNDYNHKENDKRAKTLRDQGVKVNRANLMKLRLYEFQKGLCLYTGTQLSVGNLFDGTVEIDHILPRSETGDNGIGNLALSLKTANAYKGKKSPHAAFSPDYKGQDYAVILKRVEDHRRGSLWRFGEDAMERFTDNNQFQDRFLNDTRYVAKIAAKYLGRLVANSEADILTVRGGMTAQMRHLWGLDEVITELMVEAGRLPETMLASAKLKTDAEHAERREARRKLRFDHRHHLMDAVVVGCITRSDVQRLETLSARTSGYSDLKETLTALEESGKPLFRRDSLPWREGFRQKVKDFLSETSATGTPGSDGAVTRVTHKPDHNPLGQLHNETKYRVIVPVPDDSGQYICAAHHDLAAIIKREDLDKITIPQSLRGDLVGAVEKIRETEPDKVFAWGGRDPVAAFDNLARELNILREQLVENYDNPPVLPENPGEAAPSASKIEKDTITRAVEKLRRETGQRRYLKVQKLTLEMLQGPEGPGKRERRMVSPSSNDRLVHWIDRETKRHWDVIRTLDAVRPGFREPWEDVGGRLIFRLRKGDVVEMQDPKHPENGRALYQVKTISSGDIEFIPVEEARTPLEGRKSFTVRCQSEKMLNNCNIQHVVMTLDGRVRWHSKPRN